MATHRVIGLCIATVVAMALIFWWVGGFSLRQSLTISAVALIGGWLFYEFLWATPIGRASETTLRQASFTPYWVSVSPNWSRLLDDFPLLEADAVRSVVTDRFRINYPEIAKRLEALADRFQNETLTPEEKTAVFLRQASGAPSEAIPEDILCRGFRFTVLTPYRSRVQLIYRHDYKTFSTGVDFTKNMVGAELDDAELDDWLAWLGLGQVYIREGPDGYELGLLVREKWAEANPRGGRLQEVRKRDTRPELGTTRLILVVLPYAEFDFYHDGSQYYMPPEKLREHRDKLLAENGWVRKSQDIVPEAGLSHEWLEHTYFTVEHHEI